MSSGLCLFLMFFFCFKQKTAYEMRISDWSSDVCSSDLIVHASVAQEFSRRVAEKVAQFKLGSGFDPDVAIGPLIDEAAVAGVDELVQDALSRGATLVTGGKRRGGAGTFFEPTVQIGRAHV